MPHYHGRLQHQNSLASVGSWNQYPKDTEGQLDMLIRDPLTQFQKTSIRMFLAVLNIITQTLKLPLSPQIVVAWATVWRQTLKGKSDGGRSQGSSSMGEGSGGKEMEAELT